MAGRLIGKLILLTIALIGCLLWTTMYCGFFPSGMVKTTGKVVSTSYYVVSFEYFVDQKKYKSNRASCGTQKCKGDLLKLHKNSTVTVFYNKRIPSFGVLSTRYYLSDFYLVIGISFLILVLVILLVVFDKKISNELLFGE